MLCILVLNYPLGESTGASFPPQVLLTDVLIHVFKQIFSKQQQIWLKIGLFLKRLFNTGLLLVAADRDPGWPFSEGSTSRRVTPRRQDETHVLVTGTQLSWVRESWAWPLTPSWSLFLGAGAPHSTPGPCLCHLSNTGSGLRV